MNKPQKAFTLSEVMLVLSVIGVIAALTIPGIMQNTQNKQAVTRIKRIYSLLNQAYTNNVATYESAENYSLLSNEDYLNAFVSKMNVIKNCGNNSGCWYTNPIKGMDGSTVFSDFNTSGYTWGKAILADGSVISGGSWNDNCNHTDATIPELQNSVCGHIMVDINGQTGPNTLGRDVFRFYVTKKVILPFGIPGDGYLCNNTSSGWGCTAKVITENAINY